MNGYPLWILATAIALATCGRDDHKQAATPTEATTVTIAHAGPLTGGIAHQGKDDENGVRLGYKVSLRGATRTVTFDEKGDRRDAEMTIFRMIGGRIKPVAMIRNGQVNPL